MSFVYFQATEYDFIKRAQRAGRFEQLGGYDGCRALFDYYSESAENTGEPIQLDVIALCCDWAHYADLLEAAQDYLSPDDFRELCEMDGDDQDERILDSFRYETTVLQLDNGEYLIQAF